MKDKIKFIMPFLLKAYLAYSIVADAIVVSGIVYLIFGG